jgi:N-acyl-phosphatidylethanolamine-hydrolysing phospholipase D
MIALFRPCFLVSLFFCLIALLLSSSKSALSAEAVTVHINNTDNSVRSNSPPHHVNGKFRNPHLPADFQPSFIAFLKARLFDDLTWPEEPDNYRKFWQSADLEKIHNPDFNRAQATLIGHSTVLLQYRGINILTDPIFSERSSFSQNIGPKRFTPPAITVDQLPSIDIIVISHNHYDHLDVGSIEALTHADLIKKSNGQQPLWLVPLGLKQWFTQFENSRVEELDWWQTVNAGELTIQAQPSQHWSRRSIFDTNESLWASWAFTWPKSESNDKFTAWFGGDTAYNPYQFKEIGEVLGQVDLAMIPIGAYEPRWFMKTQHVNPLDAVEIFKDINAKSAFGIHWNTFVLTAEPIDEPPKALESALHKNGLESERFQAMDIGKTWSN